ncbi:erythromycin esterase family protein [Streptomyces sp. BE308]|uniref:erythromycin esterase family protein n=1 Tax=Streptomyces sp. BE308 TaxID=3002529 RepID=UPI002E77F70D|nr:erythromycin esterase family protein [Streptomyces sp. BE308]MEE1795942.1 erythromycin esterase family protein [Streptomyces sp. BE308]
MTETVTQWIRQHAHPLTTLDPEAPLTDLSPPVGLIGDAEVVAIGASTRQHHESGTGNPEASLSGARSFWRTEEMLDLVRWMRSYNRRNPDDPVRFTEDLGSSRTPRPDDRAGIDRDLAESVRRWHEHSGDRIVYFGSGYLSIGLVPPRHGSVPRSRSPRGVRRRRPGQRRPGHLSPGPAR